MDKESIKVLITRARTEVFMTIARRVEKKDQALATPTGSFLYIRVIIRSLT
jgi:hypothetical protein